MKPFAIFAVVCLISVCVVPIVADGDYVIFVLMKIGSFIEVDLLGLEN